MATQRRDLVVNIDGDSRGFTRATKSAQASASTFERELRKMEAEEERRRQSMEQSGKVIAGFGVAMVAGLGLATKAASDWESAWAGVTKTVEGSPQQMAALEGELRNLARTLPATHDEIAGVAAAAGQLGISTENVAEFTKTMVDLGETTNLTAEEAATSLARMANIMGTSQDDIDRMGAALVDLGNNSATTEAEILEMGLRIAGAGKQIGLAEDEVLGIAGALSSVGIRAEAGGTAISRVFVDIANSVDEGGDKLDTFAEVAGMTTEQFSQRFEQDAAGAISAFLQGLGRVEEQGGSTFQTLDELGLSGVRVRDVLLRASGAQDLFNQSLETSSEAWEKNTALAEEAQQRYQTTAARVEIARNNIVDFAVDLGETFLPAVAGAADRTQSWLGLLQDLPGPVKQAGAMLGGISGATALIGGASLIAIPKVQRFMDTLDGMGPTSQRTARGLRRVGTILRGPWGLALAGATTALALWVDNRAEAAQKTREYADALDADSGAIGRHTRELVADKLAQEGALDAAENLGLELGKVTEAVLKPQSQAYRDVNDRLNQLDTRFESAGQSGLGFGQRTNENTESVKALRTAIGAESDALQQARRRMDQKDQANQNAKESAEELSPQEQAIADKFGTTANEAGDAADAVDEFSQELDRLFQQSFSVEEAQDALARQLSDLEEQVKDTSAATKGNTDEALDNRDALRQVMQRAFGMLEAEAEAGATKDELTRKAEKLRKRLIKQLQQMGFSREEAEKYAGSLDAVPGEVDTLFQTPGLNRARDNVKDLKDKIVDLDGTYAVRLEGGGTGPQFFASGGRVGGSGTGTSDDNLIAASRGEWVIRERVSSQQGPSRMAALNSGRADIVPRFAAGGEVTINARPVARMTGGWRDFFNQFSPLDVSAPGDVSGVKAFVRDMAATRYGWSGGQWNALHALLMGESGFNPAADNPISSAHGIFQFLDSTRAAYGIPKTNSPAVQTPAGLRYISDRYGNPASAYSFWLSQSPHWYDRGGMWPSGTLGVNTSGGQEAVLTNEQWRTLRTVAQSVSRPVLQAQMAGGDGNAQPLIGSLTVTTTPNASAGQIMNETMHRVRVARLGGRR